MNLLKETKEVLKKNGKTIDDVIWIGTDKHFIDKETFIRLADTEYDAGYGSPEVATNLVIVGKDWWLEREEYDGSEWWEFNTLPIKPKEKLDVKALTDAIGWLSLEELNREIGEDKEVE